MHFATSMAFSRQQWVEKYRNRLEGALGEYTKLLIVRHFKLPDSGWENEVKALLKKVELLHNKLVVKTKTPFDLLKAAAEAFLEASTARDQITTAKNQFIHKYLDDDYKGLVTPGAISKYVSTLDSEEVLFDMCAELLSAEIWSEVLTALQTDD